MSMGNIELHVQFAESEIRRLFGQGDISGQSRASGNCAPQLGGHRVSWVKKLKRSVQKL